MDADRREQFDATQHMTVHDVSFFVRDGVRHARVRMRCQDAKGMVDPTKLPILKQWDRLHKDQRRLEAVLVDLKKEFAKPEYKKNAQPPDGTTYN